MREHLRATFLLVRADRRGILAILGSALHRLLPRGPLADFIEPALYVREFFDLELTSLPRRRPRIANHVRDGVLAGREVTLLVQAEVHDPEDAMHLVVEAQQRVREVA